MTADAGFTPMPAVVTTTVTTNGSRARVAPGRPIARELPAFGTNALALIEACRPASLSMGGPGISRLGVTSTVRGEGRSSVAMALAMVQTWDYGRRTILLDLDLDGPGLGPVLGLELGSAPGLADLVAGAASMTDVMVHVGDSFSVIGAGRTRGLSPRILNELTNSDILSRIQEQGDVLVADLPPLTASIGHQAAALFTSVALVVRAGITPARTVRASAERLVPAPSVILNGTHSSMPRWVRRLVGDVR